MLMKLVVTGALGHIGSDFIRHIRPGDYTEVVLIDNLSTQRYCSLFNLPAQVPFRFVEADVCSSDLAALFSGAAIAVHFAAITDAASSFERADQVEQVNFEGTERVARACAANATRLAFFSTTSVYGTQQSLVDENCSEEELKPQSPYAASKLRAERMLQQLGEAEGLRFVICRFGTIFGTSIGMRFHTAINRFCWQACVGQPITVWRTALHQKRPYLALKDAVRALDFIISTDRFDRQVYNVLTANATVDDIVSTIGEFVPDAQIEYVDSPIMNQLSYEVSSRKFEALGFAFQGSLRQGIQETIELLRDIRHIPGA
jgi:nucleoside-diphosphate-sugar epimerase